MFVGVTKRGPLGEPTRILSYGEFERTFGADDSISQVSAQIRQFFINGGSQAYVTRVANDPKTASLVLKNAAGVDVMTVAAAEPGESGNGIHVEVDYATAAPEATFNLRVYRLAPDARGNLVVEVEEYFRELQVADSSASRYAAAVVAAESQLIRITVAALPGSPAPGFSISGLLFANNAAIPTFLTTALGVSSLLNAFRVSVDGTRFVSVVLAPGDTSASAIASAINTTLGLNGISATVAVSFVEGVAGQVAYVRIASVKVSGSVRFMRAEDSAHDLAGVLGLGAEQGGLDFGPYATFRPAPTGYVSGGGDPIVSLLNFGLATPTTLEAWSLVEGGGRSFGATPDFSPLGAATKFHAGPDAPLAGSIGSLRNVRRNLNALAASIRGEAGARWNVATSGTRLILTPRFGDPIGDLGVRVTSSGDYDLGTGIFAALPNSKAVQLGAVSATYPFASTAVRGTNGNPPGLSDYSAAYQAISSKVDVFNLLILPEAATDTPANRLARWGEASSFCQRERAFLLVDPDPSWKSVSDVEAGLSDLRSGLVKDHSALYWPRVVAAGSSKPIDPSGTIAGLMARTDASRGVWKAPAGLEASLLGIRSVDVRMSDAENGVINPLAVNAIRSFPNGIVSWGARTNDGANANASADYRYVPVRRTALFIEESLYRGLQFAVFEPNDEPLWAQIRLAAGAFMNNLFRQGAFQGQKARDAYFVKCDAETTTQNDINLGIVNVQVGFAALKPAEFVVLTLTQRAGEVSI
jgi:hypothetical protein